mgnify:CR=1 FL=1
MGELQTKERVLSIQNLIIKFKLRGQVLTAIRDISLDLYKGEISPIIFKAVLRMNLYQKC